MTRLVELLLVVATFAIMGSNMKAYDSVPEPTILHQSVEIQKVSENDSVLIIKDTVPVYEQKTFDEFLEKLAWRESRGNWKIVNRFGYMGKYQIGKLALKDIGMDSIKASDFRKDPNVFPEHLQEIAIRKYIKKNKLYLKDCIDCYKNTTVNGILITESSIIGAAHLVGQKNVKEWLDCDGHVKKVDGNGVTIESYLKLFSGYKLS